MNGDDGECAVEGLHITANAGVDVALWAIRINGESLSLDWP
uniref:Uncharacterized protein n=1 Tax=Arundo donax TaxID=35708 RepID=A0A0A9C7A9_ARUDO